MYSVTINLVQSAVAYLILLPVALALVVVASTWFFTNLRYHISLKHHGDNTSTTKSPIQIPYALPFLGSALDFLNTKTGSFWTFLLRKYCDVAGACTLKMGGRNMHILYDPHTIQALFKARGPTRDNFNIDVVVKGFGVEHSECLKFTGYNDGPSEELGGRTPKHEQERLSDDYLLKKDSVNELTSKFAEILREDLSHDQDGNVENQTVKLYKWIRKHVFKASTVALMGATILEDYPTLENDFYDLDTNFLACYFGIPKWVVPDVYNLRDKLTMTLTQHHERQLERNKGHVVDPDGNVAWEPVQGSRANRARQIYYNARGINLRSKGLLDLGMIFGIATNSVPAIGWFLMHILDPNGDKTLLPRVMAEINTSKLADGTFDITTLVTQPLLLSILHEILRLYVDNLVTREIPKDLNLPVGVNDKLLLRQGSIVVAPSWLSHRNDSLWTTPDAQTFHGERFLTSHPDTGSPVFSTVGTAGRFFPFGGGKTICPGRVFAKQEILASVAMILDGFDVEVVGYLDKKGVRTGKFPGLRDAYPGPAIMNMSGDFEVRLRKRG